MSSEISYISDQEKYLIQMKNKEVEIAINNKKETELNSIIDKSKFRLI